MVTARGRRGDAAGVCAGHARDPVTRPTASVGRTPCASATTKPLTTRVAVDRCARPPGRAYGGAWHRRAARSSPRPALVGAVLREPLEGRPDLGGRDSRWGRRTAPARPAGGCSASSSGARSRAPAPPAGADESRPGPAPCARASGQLVQGVEGRAELGSSLRSRWKIRAVCRRWAWVRRAGRTHDSGSSSRCSFGQRCQAAMNESRTAPRDAGRSPVSAKAWTRSRSRASA